MSEHQPDVRGLIAAQTALGAELTGKLKKAEDALVATRATLAEHVEENLTLHARCAELEATLRDEQARTDKWVEAHGALVIRAGLKRETLQARIASAMAILSEPGMWSDFAARAKKALSDG